MHPHLAGHIHCCVRHAESLDNRLGIKGNHDAPLRNRGRRDGRLLAESLAGQAFPHVVHSVTVRTRQTATPIAERLGCPLRCDPAFDSLDLGGFRGRNKDAVKAATPPYGQQWPGGESRLDAECRVIAGVRRLLRATPADAPLPLLVLHNTVLKVLDRVIREGGDRSK